MDFGGKTTIYVGKWSETGTIGPFRPQVGIAEVHECAGCKRTRIITMISLVLVGAHHDWSLMEPIVEKTKSSTYSRPKLPPARRLNLPLHLTVSRTPRGVPVMVVMVDIRGQWRPRVN